MSIVETITSIANVATTVILASVALIFSFRQNVGWKPICFVAGGSFSGRGGSQEYELSVSIEFWNRRKYPVVVRDMTIHVSGVTIENRDYAGVEEDYIRGNRLVRRIGKPVAPSEHIVLDAALPFENQSLDAMQPLFDVTIRYFDPYRNKHHTAEFRHLHFSQSSDGQKLTKRDWKLPERIAQCTTCPNPCEGESKCYLP